MAAIAIAQSTIPATKYQDGDSIDFAAMSDLHLGGAR
jgi:hypothetical protein